MDFYFAAFLDPSTIGLLVKNIGGTRLPDEPKISGCKKEESQGRGSWLSGPNS
jgi:hypothetical protein